MRTSRVLIATGSIALALVARSAAGWVSDGVRICLDNGQSVPAAATTGVGGAFVAFVNGDAVVCQYLTPSGSTFPPDLRCADTLAVVEGFSSLSSGSPRITPTESGGAIVAFLQARNGSSIDVFAQAVDGLAARLWGPTGVPVCTASGDQRFAENTFGTIASDGQGGCYIVWEDPRLPANGYDIFTQHLTSTGAVASGWPVNGLQLTNQLGDQRQASVVSDDAGGAIVAWQGTLPNNDHDIFASRLLSNGTLATGWSANGNVVCSTPDDQSRPVLTKDGAGGAIVAWQDGRGVDVYAQHIRSDGTVDPQWPANGAAVAPADSSQLSPEITSDGNGGAFVVWADNRTVATAPDIYAQHVTSSGVHDPNWLSDGLPICTEPVDQNSPLIVPDGTGGMITCWTDKRTAVNQNVDIYAQRVTAGGTMVWTLNGLAICTDPSPQDTPAIAVDSYGGAVIAWRDTRSTSFGQIFAQRVGHDGDVGSLASVPVSPGARISLRAWPNPARVASKIRIAGGEETLAVYVSDLGGRTVRTLFASSSGRGDGEVAWDLRDETHRRVPPGMYWVRARSQTGQNLAQTTLIVLH